MKTLFVSLLRVGDLISHARIVAQYRREHANETLHLLVNESCLSYAQFLLSKKRIDGFSILPRDVWQTQLIEPGRRPFNAWQGLRALVEKMKAESYDRVIDLTHSSFAARLLDLIPAREQKGVRFHNGKATGLVNAWAAWMNGSYPEQPQVPFHLLEVLAHSRELSAPPLSSVTQVADRFQHRICLQISTSDAKKAWSDLSWKNLMQRLRATYPTLALTILAAPGEAASLRDRFPQESAAVVEAKWSELQNIFSETRILVSVDTSVLHFAVECGVPVLGLYLGSANPQKTGPAQIGARILQAQPTCSPCRHRADCSQLSHVCGEMLSPQDVLSVLASILETKGSPKLSLGVRDFTVENNRGHFLIRPTGEATMEVKQIRLSSAFEQLIWQIYLDGGMEEAAVPVGSATHVFLEDYARELFAAGGTSWLERREDLNTSDSLFLDEILSQALQAGQFLQQQETDSDSKFNAALAQVQQSLEQYLARPSITGRQARDFFYQLKTALASTFAGFGRLRQIRMAIDETRKLLKLEEKLVRTMITEITERGPVYVAGFRETSADRFAAT